jgi:hypothetical protein
VTARSAQNKPANSAVMKIEFVQASPQLGDSKAEGADEREPDGWVSRRQ